MGELHWRPEADRAMTSLEADPARAALVQRIESLLETLEDDPGHGSVRPRRYQGGIWRIDIRAGDDDWLLLWEPHPDVPGDVIIQYLGPDI